MSNSFHSRREHRRVLRLITEHPLRVVIGSIGNEIRYEMITRNVSYTGFFLKFDKPGRFPFTPASILDVWLELEPQKFLFFNGKMARIVYPEDAGASETGPGIAIRIVQITSEAEYALKSFIDREVRKQKESERDAPENVNATDQNNQEEIDSSEASDDPHPLGSEDYDKDGSAA